MAHADYDCCAVCDCKMAYNSGDARTKETLCPECAFAVAKYIPELSDPTVSSLMAWMKAGNPADVIGTLKSIGYERCFYQGAIDDLYDEIAAKIPATT